MKFFPLRPLSATSATAALLFALSPLLLQAEPVVVRSNTANGEIRLTVNNDPETGEIIGSTLSTTGFHSTNASTVGSGGSSPNRRNSNIVYFFQLPVLELGQTIGSASLSLAYVASRFDAVNEVIFEPNLDLYGITSQATPARSTDWFYHGPDDPAATLIQASFLTPTAPAVGRVDTSAVGNANLSVFLNGLYDSGAAGGDFAVIRLNLDEDFNPNSSITRYQFQGSRAVENVDNDAYLTYEVIPEPSTVGLILGGVLLGFIAITRRGRSRK